jgi:hypothetical protein
VSIKPFSDAAECEVKSPEGAAVGYVVVIDVGIVLKDQGVYKRKSGQVQLVRHGRPCCKLKVLRWQARRWNTNETDL